jgi:hypothetical protein
MARSSLVGAVGLGLILFGCGTTAPESDGYRTEAAPALQLPEGHKLSAAVPTETSVVYFLETQHGIDMLEVGDLSSFEPVLARLAAPSTPLEIYLGLTGASESDAPQELVAAHYAARGVKPGKVDIAPMAALREKVQALADAEGVRVAGISGQRMGDGLIDKAAPQRLGFSIGDGDRASCTGPNAVFLAYYGQIAVSGITPTFAGCESPNVCITTAGGTFSESGVGTVRTASGCNGRASSASVNILTDKDAPFCPSCPPALPYLGPIFSLRPGSAFLYVETGGSFAGSMSVAAGGGGLGTLITLALH